MVFKLFIIISACEIDLHNNMHPQKLFYKALATIHSLSSLPYDT